MTDVLVLRALGLGDLLTAVPALRGLRRAWPGARLVLGAPGQLGEWLTSLGVVDAVLPVRGVGGLPSRLGAPRPAVAVNLHGCGPQSHRLLRTLRPGRLVGYACPAAGHLDGPPWDGDEHEVDRWLRLAHWVGGAADVEDLRLPPPARRGAHVVVHPGAAAPARCWPAARWAAVAGALARAGHPVVVTGTAGEAARCAAVARSAPGAENRCGRDELAGLAETVGSARLLLSGDTGVAHLATAFGTPSVTLFGPVSPAVWGPRIDRDRHAVLWRGEPGPARQGDPHGQGVDRRLAAVTVGDVLGAAGHLLAGQAVRAPSSAEPSGPCRSLRTGA